MLINREQQRVIDEVEQNILLLASAGTGKTNTLAYRVAHLIEDDFARLVFFVRKTLIKRTPNHQIGRAHV